MAIGLNSMLRRASNAIYAPLGDEGVMLNIESGNYHSLNDVGARIWELLETPKTVVQLRDHLLAEFDVGKEACQAAVLGFVGELQHRGLVNADA